MKDLSRTLVVWERAPAIKRFQQPAGLGGARQSPEKQEPVAATWLSLHAHRALARTASRQAASESSVSGAPSSVRGGEPGGWGAAAEDVMAAARRWPWAPAGACRDQRLGPVRGAPRLPRFPADHAGGCS